MGRLSEKGKCNTPSNIMSGQDLTMPWILTCRLQGIKLCISLFFFALCAKVLVEGSESVHTLRTSTGSVDIRRPTFLVPLREKNAILSGERESRKLGWDLSHTSSSIWSVPVPSSNSDSTCDSELTHSPHWGWGELVFNRDLDLGLGAQQWVPKTRTWG